MLKFPENYENGKNLYKPLKLKHGYTLDYFDFEGLGSEGGFEQVCHTIEQSIDGLIEIGYGGIVTNISFRSYFEDETAKRLLKHKIEYCKKKGLRVWLYDERGYPSGKAGGLTLKKNPDFEAKGLAGMFETVKPGESLSIKFPRGHEKVVAAYSYEGACFDDMDINSAVSLTGNLSGGFDLDYTNDTEKTRFVAYFVSKRLYEGTHAERNYDDARRYPDLMNKEAVGEFISNTYEAYKEIAGEYFGNTIEAVFTDEPSCVAYYLPKLPAVIHDQPDESIPLLPVLNWTNDFKARFQRLCGYDIDKYLPYVFGGNTARAFDVREDFHYAVSKFYEEAFFAQIGDFCRKNNVAFSGHLLMEENLSLHPPFEGNFFHQLKHMQYPGIDVLTTIPESILNHMAQVPKLVSSAALLSGKKHVMSEASGYQETIAVGKENLNYRQMIGACALQYALGVDTIVSYYQRGAIDKPDHRLWNETLGRIAAIMSAGTQKAKILLYYPIETAARYYLPQYNWSEEGQKYLTKYDLSFAKKGAEAAASWAKLSRSLLKGQLDYFMTDFELLAASKFEGGKIKIGGNENDFEVLVLPVCDMTEKLQKLIKELNEQNITVLSVAPGFGDGIKKAEKLEKLENFKIYKDEKDLIKNLKSMITPDVVLNGESGSTDNIVYMKKENENGFDFLFVNAAGSAAAAETKIYLGESDKKDYKLFMYNPETDEEIPFCYEITGGKAVFDLHLPAYGFIFIFFRFTP